MVTGLLQDKIFYTEVKLKQKDLLNSQEFQSKMAAFAKLVLVTT